MIRDLRKAEYDLIVYLLKGKISNDQVIGKLSTMLVEEMNDGGMGSLKFLYSTKTKQGFREQLAEITLLDKDGVPVSFAINSDTDGDIYELDVFKADFSTLIEFPIPPYN